ncbi:hypothetical protein DL732_19500 [Escherichia coli]|nr:hypothetical protein [Escherichia coli]EFW2244406.1 hypothetical protein [Shigella sonnei]EHX59951.1 hypothetical protein ECDEC13C_3191 [Escherichia coli DEC13C]EMV59334.1 hypothetical protein EC2871950_2180 [Escherichia coli 2871950]END27481.1 hypothetical protein EC179100_5473 [Escherichia coli 179100]
MAFIMSVFDGFTHYHKRWVLYDIGNSRKIRIINEQQQKKVKRITEKALQADLSCSRKVS